MDIKLTDTCSHCGAPLGESMLAPVYCDMCEDDLALEIDCEGIMAAEDLFNV